ncbi:bacillithiol biosynthesis cysteine-adding enzyme BshC [Desertivirga xinjiangensis]|uniref:bacillithiol biosynthesis cysteine-adding enzyme BshC n=1 Tax=Desertivirga xinjiangensis TaxID=539206 RepID=UPI002109736F|nr:bacillithiol biosynthesis cysteine-adding enzyme BshC [Pedobacter xinjiangensis]
MKASYIDYNDTLSFSPAVISYLAHDPRLKPFVYDFPGLDKFEKLIQDKKVLADRDNLVSVLEKQYSRLKCPVSDKVARSIDLLRSENTYTITTGHQLNLFTGPLYFIYKIVTAVNLANELKDAYPDRNFVPVYWMATEDHDFAEINHTSVHGKKIAWERAASGATGRLDTQTVVEAVRVYQNALGISENSKVLCEAIETAYLEHDRLADATRYLVNFLFKDFGLVIIDADDIQLKQQFAPVIEKDIIEQLSFKAINESSEELKKAGFNTQVNSREINFFYMKDDLRERITFENGLYYVLNTNIKFNTEELKTEIRSFPDRFSPNVVMRPVYQEIILPNLAYIGGGAELVYRLQLKKSFSCHQVDFPILVLRNSALLTQHGFSSKLCHLHIDTKDLFKPVERIKSDWVLAHSDHVLHLSDEWNELNSIFEKIKLRTYKIDPTLAPSSEAIKARLKKAMGNLEKKLLKADKRNHQTVLEQIDNLKNKHFPGGGLQERSENFGKYYVTHGPGLIQSLVDNFKPLEAKFTILEP